MRLLSDDAVVAIDALTKVVEGQRQLIGILTEEFGGLVGLMEEVLPTIAEGELLGETRDWLLAVKRLDLDVETVLAATAELKEASDMIAERFPDRPSGD